MDILISVKTTLPPLLKLDDAYPMPIFDIPDNHYFTVDAQNIDMIGYNTVHLRGDDSHPKIQAEDITDTSEIVWFTER